MKKEHEKLLQESAQVLVNGASSVGVVYRTLVNIYGIGKGVGFVEGMETANKTAEILKR